jgi:hypothetical protein
LRFKKAFLFTRFAIHDLFVKCKTCLAREGEEKVVGALLRTKDQGARLDRLLAYGVAARASTSTWVVGDV